MSSLRLATILLSVVVLLFAFVNAEDPYRFFEWNVTYSMISIASPQQVILINGQFPGPDIHAVTNDNLIINVFNNLDEPFLFSWNGVQQRRNSWQDGVYGTNCPIPPGQNWTYTLQVKDQIGSFFYYPSLSFHKAAGGFGGIRILSRPRIPVPFPDPAGDYTVLIGDWYHLNHTRLRTILENQRAPFPGAVLINGKTSTPVTNAVTYTVQQGKTYRFRISNVGLHNSLNIRIQNHNMTLVEVEGTHTIQTNYTSLDIHVGQSYSVLVTADQLPQDYFMVVTTRFSTIRLEATALFSYSNSNGKIAGPVDASGGPSNNDILFSLKQALSIRTNLTASGPRPNPQGSYHYGMINITRTIRLSNSAALVDNKQRYAINSVSFVPADTPLKIADHFKIPGVFRLGSILDSPPGTAMYLDTSVVAADFRAFVEIIFENQENTLQSYHIDGYSFFVVGMDAGVWSESKREQYNLIDAIARCTVQVYPQSWTAIYVPLDNVGMWNIRSEFWARQYLGQQFYLRVYSPVESVRDEKVIPPNALLCGRATSFAPPTVAPVVPPAVAPTAVPVVPPTAAPVVSPIGAPPTAPSTAAPAVSPIVAPPVEPVVPPSDAPVVSPIVAPTAAPIGPPPAAPIGAPPVEAVDPPTAAPAVSPIVAPPVEPVVPPTAAPVVSPILAPTDTPEVSPTAAPVVSPIVSPIGSPTGSSLR
ncbi:hypothetical protein MKW98_018906 [Papaver atlanticum]|uniref:Uncharacterized protein n=1 Tax=Papaver atlanticum TaxID=357466 RepID=A0AAD4TJE9_9MAGN|nr:hypothetical protein MKW98_018906 [Papaver atlanticum]